VLLLNWTRIIFIVLLYKHVAFSFIIYAVVWNPWDKKAKAMSDFGDDEYKHMLCVEAAAIEKPITLKPGEEWKGRLELSTVPSSYYSGQLDPVRVVHGS